MLCDIFWFSLWRLLHQLLFQMLLYKFFMLSSIVDLGENDNIFCYHTCLLRQNVCTINDGLGDLADLFVVHPERILNWLDFLLALLIISIFLQITVVNDLWFEFVCFFEVLNSSEGLAATHHNEIIVVTDKIRPEFFLAVDRYALSNFISKMFLPQPLLLLIILLGKNPHNCSSKQILDQSPKFKIKWVISFRSFQNALFDFFNIIWHFENVGLLILR